MPTIGAAINTATVVISQRKTKSFIRETFRNLPFASIVARKRLPTGRCALNELKSLTPINLCPKRAKLSKAKIKHRRKPADRPLKLSPANRLARSVHRRVEKAPDEFPRKVRLRKKQKPRCLPRREQ